MATARARGLADELCVLGRFADYQNDKELAGKVQAIIDSLGGLGAFLGPTRVPQAQADADALGDVCKNQYGVNPLDIDTPDPCVAGGDSSSYFNPNNILAGVHARTPLTDAVDSIGGFGKWVVVGLALLVGYMLLRGSK